jgi:hypothetical protein
VFDDVVENSEITGSYFRQPSLVNVYNASAEVRQYGDIVVCSVHVTE